MQHGFDRSGRTNPSPFQGLERYRRHFFVCVVQQETEIFVPRSGLPDGMYYHFKYELHKKDQQERCQENVSLLRRN